MKNKITLFVFLLLFSHVVFGQIAERKEVYGKVFLDSIAIESVNVVNQTTNKSIITDENGAFFLFVKEGDVLVFSAINLMTLFKKIEKQDLSTAIVSFYLISKSISLKEVIIDKHTQINAENLGIIPYGQKKYTPAERKLKTAGDFKPIMLLGLIGGSMPLDPLINKINGRTKRLKREVILERKELNLSLLTTLFENNFFVETLKIPSEYIEGFKYYAVEDEKFTVTLNSKNKTTMEFLLGELAVKYNDIITNEK